MGLDHVPHAPTRRSSIELLPEYCHETIHRSRIERKDRDAAVIDRKQSHRSGRSNRPSFSPKRLRSKSCHNYKRFQRSPSPTLPTVTEYERACFKQEDQKLLESFRKCRSWSDMRHSSPLSNKSSGRLPSRSGRESRHEMPMPPSLRRKRTSNIEHRQSDIRSSNILRQMTQDPMKIQQRVIRQDLLQSQLKSLNGQLHCSDYKDSTFEISWPASPNNNRLNKSPQKSRDNSSRKRGTANITETQPAGRRTSTTVKSHNGLTVRSSSASASSNNLDNHKLQTVLGILEHQTNTISPPPPPPPGDASPNFSSHVPSPLSLSPLRRQRLALEEDGTVLTVIKKGDDDTAAESRRPAMRTMANEKMNAGAPISPKRVTSPRLHQRKRVAPSAL